MGQSVRHEGQAPFDIFFNYMDDYENTTKVSEPYNPRAIPCYEAVSNSTGPCSCVDCAGSCPKPQPWPPLPVPWIIAGMDGLTVVMVIIFAVGSNIIAFTLVYVWICRGKKLDSCVT